MSRSRAFASGEQVPTNLRRFVSRLLRGSCESANWSAMVFVDGLDSACDRIYYPVAFQ